MNCELTYQGIKNGSVLVENLQENEISALFSYLCTLIEQGREVDEDLLCLCANTASELPPAEKVMEKESNYQGKYLHQHPLGSKDLPQCCTESYSRRNSPAQPGEGQP